MQERLNQAGIYTYAQLAGARPQDLCAALKEVASIAVTKEKARRRTRDARKLVRE